MYVSKDRTSEKRCMRGPGKGSDQHLKFSKRKVDQTVKGIGYFVQYFDRHCLSSCGLNTTRMNLIQNSCNNTVDIR